MGIVLFAFKSFIRRGSKSFLAILILAFGLIVFFIGNALLDGSAAGLTKVYRDGLIGDAVVGQTDRQPVSIWGYEELFSTQFTKIPVLEQGSNLESELSANPGLLSVCPMAASAALLEIEKFRGPIYLMGVDSSRYFPTRNFHYVTGGAPRDDNQPWIVISLGLARAIFFSVGRFPAMGEKIQITFADGNGFVIRGIPLAGIIDFPVNNAALDSLCLVDLPSAWELLGLSRKKAEIPTILPSDTGTDDLFADTSGDQTGDQTGSQSTTGKSWNNHDIATLLAANPETNQRPKIGADHFLLLQFKKSLGFGELSRQFKVSGETHNARLMDWETAAGQSLRYIVSIQRIFNGGMGLFSLLIIMIFINTLGNALIERKAEIGILRALGARRKKVSLVFIIEYVCIGFVALVISMAVSSLLVTLINAASIHLNNEILVNLFGNTTLSAVMEPALVFKGLALSLLLPILVVFMMSARLAAISPQEAMQNGT